MKRILSWLKLIGICILMIPVLLLSFIVFTLWELLDKKSSRAFWDEVYDPYNY